jgi:hypothetical protein
MIFETNFNMKHSDMDFLYSDGDFTKFKSESEMDIGLCNPNWAYIYPL